jgi:hypothetical protein
MSEDLETARRYRAHAEELRLIAEAVEDRPNRRILIEVAKDYERMASSLEALHKSNTSWTSRFDYRLF